MDGLVMRDCHEDDIERVPLSAPAFGEALCAADSVCIYGTDPGILMGRGERLAKAFGAEVVDNTKGDGVQGVRDLTGGRVVLTGVPLEKVGLPLQRIVLEEMGVNGGRATRGTCEETIALAAAGKVNVKALITHRFPLRDFRKACEVFTKCVDGTLEVLVKPSQK
jgi:L-iditol 2-dehydrogenase